MSLGVFGLSGIQGIAPTTIGGMNDAVANSNKGVPIFTQNLSTGSVLGTSDNIPTNATGLNQINTTGSLGSALQQTPVASSGTSANDDRIRLGHLSGYGGPGGSGQYPGIQAPLQQTQGMMFPYSPTIQIAQQVNYKAMDFTHSNWNYYYYQNTPNAKINISGKFTVQNQTEGLYAIAAIQFLRSVSKMNFGQKDQNAGLPPPMLQLNGYGDYMFKNIRVFLETHSYNYEEGMDTVAVSVSGGRVRLPALFTISITLVTQPTVNMMRNDFSLSDYYSGALLQSGKGFF